jgi:hypothetical protein
MTQMTQNNPFLKKRSLGSAVDRVSGPDLMREIPTAAREAWVNPRRGAGAELDPGLREYPQTPASECNEDPDCASKFGREGRETS